MHTVAIQSEDSISTYMLMLLKFGITILVYIGGTC